MKKYRFKEYNKKYPKLFEKEKERLSRIFSDAKIEHIGSTAVAGLGGKGSIDIAISVPKKEIEKTKQKLISGGYTLKESGGDKDRLFFERDSGLFRKKRVHLQLTSNNSNVWKSAIKFREVLKKNKGVREEYESIKKQAVKLGKEGKEYREYKSKFIRKIIRK